MITTTNWKWVYRQQFLCWKAKFFFQSAVPRYSSSKTKNSAAEGEAGKDLATLTSPLTRTHVPCNTQHNQTFTQRNTQHNQTLLWGCATKTNPTLEPPPEGEWRWSWRRRMWGQPRALGVYAEQPREWETHGTRSSCFPYNRLIRQNDWGVDSLTEKAATSIFILAKATFISWRALFTRWIWVGVRLCYIYLGVRL